MRLDPLLLSLLACPVCARELVVHRHDPVEPDGHVLEGELACAACGRRFPIRGGVPRLVPAPLRADVAGTVGGFGYQWRMANAVLMNRRFSAPEVFLDFIQPVVAEAFRDRLVLDAGCGIGRFTVNAAAFGARLVVGVDLSDSVEQAFGNTRGLANVLIVQGDLFALPLQARFDYAFSVGVLHHTPDPRGAFLAVASRVVPGGTMSAWVYGRESNGWIVHLVNPVRRATSRLPRPLLLALAHLVAAPLTLAVRLLYAPASRRPAQGWLRRVLPYFDYLAFLAQFGYREHAYIVFDHLVPELAFYIPRASFEEWFAAAGCVDVVTSSRAGNSWRGTGRLALAD